MLAIVIPYFKLTFFRETLQSLSEQTDKRFKAYIGDDASPENPSFLLKEYAGKFDFEYKRFENNLGSKSLVKQWERCIEMIGDEEWIMVLGDDDVLGENVVKEFNENLLNIEYNKINLVRFSTQILDEIKNTISKPFLNPQFEAAADFYSRRYNGETRSSLSEHIFRKRLFKKYSFKNYPLAWHSDDYAWIQFAEDKPIFAINNAIVSIRVSNESLTGMNTNFRQKKIAESLFFFDLVKHSMHLFNEEMRLHFLLKAEECTGKIRRLTLYDWCILFFKHIQNFKFVVFLKFLRRFFKSFLT